MGIKFEVDPPLEPTDVELDGSIYRIIEQVGVNGGDRGVDPMYVLCGRTDAETLKAHMGNSDNSKLAEDVMRDLARSLVPSVVPRSYLLGASHVFPGLGEETDE